MEVERTSFLLEIGATKDEVCSIQFHTSMDKEAMEEDYQKALKVIFVYDYGCCVFIHNIRGDHLEVPDGMPYFSVSLPLEFLVNPRRPPVPTATEDTAVGAHPSEVTKDLEENASIGDQG